MNPLLDFKIRFSDAAYAIESTPKALRNWIQKGQVTLVSEDTGGWREFSLAEIAILAVINDPIATDRLAVERRRSGWFKVHFTSATRAADAPVAFFAARINVPGNGCDITGFCNVRWCQ